MKKVLLAVITYLCLFGPARTNVYGQSTCAQTLRTARATYDQGRLHELPEILAGCLENGFTKQEKVEAYKLLALAHLYLENRVQADEAMLHLLESDPYFKINPTVDPAEFIALYNTFRTWPVYRAGIKLGVNATMPFVVSTVSALEGTDASYQAGISFQASAAFEIPLSNKFTIAAEPGFILRAYQYDSKLTLSGDEENTSEGMEEQTCLSLPVSLQYCLSQKSRLHPYIGLGVAGDYLLDASLTMSRIRVNANSEQEQTFDITDARNTFNLSAIASAGIKMPLGGGYVVTELRIRYGITKINNPSTAFAVNDYLLFDSGYTDNEMKLNAISITAGYVYNIFKPKKLRNKK